MRNWQQTKDIARQSQSRPRRDSRESIKFCEHNNHRATFQDLDDVLIRTDSNGSQRLNMIALRAITSIKTGIDKDCDCSLGSKCHGTVKLVWYAGGRLRGRDDDFHVVDSIVDGLQAVIHVPESSPIISSRPDYESAYPTYLGTESRADKAERERRDADAERRRMAEFEQQCQEERDRQRAKKAQYMANRQAIDAGH